MGQSLANPAAGWCGGVVGAVRLAVCGGGVRLSCRQCSTVRERDVMVLQSSALVMRGGM